MCISTSGWVYGWMNVVCMQVYAYVSVCIYVWVFACICRVVDDPLCVCT